MVYVLYSLHGMGTDPSQNEDPGGDSMDERRVARVTEIIAASTKSFEDALQAGFKRASKTLRGITGMRVIEQRVSVEDDQIKEYRIRMEIIFVLEE